MATTNVPTAVFGYSSEMLLAQYGQNAQAALSWWATELPESLRKQVTARHLARAIGAHRRRKSVLTVLPRVVGKMQRDNLEQLLTTSDVSFAVIAAALDCQSSEHTQDGICAAPAGQHGWLCMLRVDHHGVHTQLAVSKALGDASLDTLTSNQNVVAALLRHLNSDQRLALVMRLPDEDKREYFLQTLRALQAASAV